MNVSNTSGVVGELFVGVLVKTVTLSLLAVLGLSGNLMVALAILVERKLHNVTNYFLCSLAVTDLFVCVLVMPLAILAEYHNGAWQFGFGLCLVHVYSDVLLCSVSIVHIAMISLDRYVGISNPLRRKHRRTRDVALKIVLVWLLTTLVTLLPLAALGAFDSASVRLRLGRCDISSPVFKMYGSTVTFVAPLFVTSVAYFKTIKLLRRRVAALRNGAVAGGPRRIIITPERKRSAFAMSLQWDRDNGRPAHSVAECSRHLDYSKAYNKLHFECL